MRLCVGFGWFFIDNFGLMCSFGLALCVELELYHIYIMDAAGSLGKSMRQILSGSKIIEHVITGRKNVDRKTFPVPRRLIQDPGSRADEQC